MSRWAEAVQILKGLKFITMAALHQPIKQFGVDKTFSRLEYKWQTGSLKPLTRSAVHKLISCAPAAASSAQSRAECLQRASMVAEGLKQGGPAIASRIAYGFQGGPTPNEVKSEAKSWENGPFADEFPAATETEEIPSSTHTSAEEIPLVQSVPFANDEKSANQSARVRQQLSETSSERKVPSSRIARVISFGGLFAGLGYGAAAEATKKILGIKSPKEKGDLSSILDDNPLLSEENAERIVKTLCRVRGAALKLGQMLSIADESVISPELQKIFDRVRYSADFMPERQVRKVLEQELGDEFMEKFEEFEFRPFAAASIGQVHRGVLKDGREVAVKLQYPGVAKSINSDINNLMSVLSVAQVLPKGMYIDSIVKVARTELALECDYLREAGCATRFAELIADDSSFYVPPGIPEMTTMRVLTTEHIYGVPLDKCLELDQSTRNWLATKILELCIREVFQFRFMQTDPNWSNFFYDAPNRRIILLDFGASRDFDKKFVDLYLKVIKSAADRDNEAILKYSRQIGFLTGYESKVMEEAHTNAVLILGEPLSCGPEGFNFATQQTTTRVQQLVPVMLKHRLTPPPDEIYSLHRKLAGVFFLCTKLKAQVNCTKFFNQIYKSYQFADEV